MKTVILILTTSLLFASCHVGRFFTRLNANITDHKIFPYTEINTGDVVYQFAESQKSLTIESKGETKPLDDFLKKTSTVSFMVIQKDSILFENYYLGYQPDNISNIFSASKSITSLLVGIALDQGKIANIQDPVTKYIPELNDADPLFKELTIEHLLDMRSGLKFKEAYLNPFAHVARLYYGTNQLKQIKRLKFESKPGTKHKYQSISTTILGMVVERATEMELGKFLEKNVWQPMGMEFEATWSVDDKKNRSTKAFCCLNTTARDLAKIGRLYINHGNWNGQQIVSKEWIERSIVGNMENDCYQNQWYTSSVVAHKSNEVLLYPDSISAVKAAESYKIKSFNVYEKSDDSGQWYINYCTQSYYAVGILGQYLFVDPKREIIIVRLGEKWDEEYKAVFNQIVYQLMEKES
ncbi:MAG: serine hydrolase domain-containing protein [Flavobacteriales bacterium]